jgi:hypothetical protein
MLELPGLNIFHCICLIVRTLQKMKGSELDLLLVIFVVLAILNTNRRTHSFPRIISLVGIRIV